MKPKKLLIILLSAVFMYSCDKSTADSALDLSIESHTFPVNGGSCTFQITSSSDWILTSSIPSWLTVSLKQGSGGENDITITAVKNSNTPHTPCILRFENTSGDKAAVTITQKQLSVYVAGFVTYERQDGDNEVTSTVWKNNEVLWESANVLIGGGGGGSFVWAAMAVQGNDVYTAGSVINEGSNDVITVWKNGVLLWQLSCKTDRAVITSMAVQGDDVYVAGVVVNGQGGAFATIWKNGQLLWEFPDGRAMNIAVQSNNVYVVGDIDNDLDESVATIWKNGIATPLPNGDAAMSIALYGNDVYIAGSGNNNAMVWKNGIATSLSLPNGMTSAHASAIALQENNVYVAGHVYNGAENIATIWKNGVATSLPNGREAISIAVFGSDIYVSGYIYDGSKEVGAIWKNGQLYQTLPTVWNKRSYAAAIAIGEE